jgi:F0F1-type ATP synthase alpha subunit
MINKVFGLDEDEETEQVTKVPKGAKLSKNLGRDTVTSFSQTKPSVPVIVNVAGNWIQDAKQHPRHRPVDKYFSDKEEQQKKIEEELQKEKQAEKAKEKTKIDEITKLLQSIKGELSKTSICLLCKRKFSSLDNYMRHRQDPKLHKRREISEN